MTSPRPYTVASLAVLCACFVVLLTALVVLIAGLRLATLDPDQTTSAPTSYVDNTSDR